jgi:hypothetical protein
MHFLNPNASVATLIVETINSPSPELGQISILRLNTSTVIMISLPHLLADISSIPWVAIVAIAGGLLIGPIVIFIVFNSIHRRHQLWHETARVALEKGQPLPPMPADVAPPPSLPPKPANDIRSGLVLIAVGAGLYLFLGSLVSQSMGYVGAIPGFIGIALLLFGLFNRNSISDQPPLDRS